MCFFHCLFTWFKLYLVSIYSLYDINVTQFLTIAIYIKQIIFFHEKDKIKAEGNMPNLQDILIY